MTEKEFNLSDKEFKLFPVEDKLYFAEDVKEFIRLLKEEMLRKDAFDVPSFGLDIIDTLAGDTLNGNNK